MLTPSDVKDIKSRITDKSNITLRIPASDKLLAQLHVLVLREIAKGSIDPKSLAMAALEEE